MGVVLAEGREEAGLPVDSGVARVGGVRTVRTVHGAERRTDVQAEQREAAGLGLLDGLGCGIVHHLLHLGLVGRLGQFGHLLLHTRLRLLERGHVLLQLVVLGLQILDRGQDFVQLVKPLEDGIAAIAVFLLLGLAGLLNRLDRLGDATGADRLALAVHDQQADAPVHEPSFLCLVADLRIPLAMGHHLDLILAGAVLDEELLHCLAAGLGELVVVAVRADRIGIRIQPYLVVLVLLKQLGQP